MLVMEWTDDKSMSDKDEKEIQKIEFKLKILKDVQAKMSTRPETETDGVTYAQFKF